MTEREIFLEAMEIAGPHARAAYLQEACGQDTTLRRKVDDLLKEHFSNDSLLAGPAQTEDRPAPTSPMSPPEAVPAQMLGRYKLLEKIGEGGFGEVWMADQREPVKRRVALKIIKPGMDSRQIVARFEAERQALAMMDHPNIAKIFDADVTDTGRPYFVMELVRGIKITEYCDQNQLPTQERLRLFILVCQAIQHAHQKGIIHRDIKPSNILVTLHDGIPVPKVIDFGIAKATQQELTDKTVFTQFQQFIGTPAYISPEQAEMSGLDIDTRADIYSLGVLLYELLVGQTPFDAKEMMQGGLDALRQIIREKEPVRPSTKLNTLPGDARTTAGKRRQTDVGKLVHQLQGDLDWIVMKCLEKDRTRRYETANGLAADIRRHLNNEAVLARPASVTYRFQKLVRRNKLAFAAATVVTTALVLGVVVSTWQAIRATRASASEAVQHKFADAQRIIAETQRNVAVEQRQLADMQLALQAWEEGDLQRANDLVDASRPAHGEVPSFEWRYLRKLCQDQSRETLGTNQPCRTTLFFDRDWLLVNDGKKLSLRNLPRRMDQLLLEDQDGILDFALCSGSTNVLATIADDGRIKVWNLAARRVQVEFQGHPRSPSASAQLHTITFSRDGSWLASAGSDNSVKLWNVEAGNTKPVRILHRYASWVSGVVFSSDGRHLFCGGSDSMIRTWNVATGAEVGAPLEGHTGWIYALALSPDGLRLACGGSDGAVVVWNVNSRRRETTFLGHGAQVMSLAFSPDQRTLAAGGTDHTIRLWDSETGQQLPLLHGHGAGVRSLSFSPDGQWLVSRSADGLAKLWQFGPGPKGNVLTGGREMALSPDGRHLASIGGSGGSEFGVSLWDLTTRTRTVLDGHSSFVVSVAFSPDGRLLATSSHDETVKLWGVRDHKIVASLTNGFPAGSLAFSPDARTLIVGGSVYSFMVGGRGGLQFWDVPSHTSMGTLPGDTSNIVVMALSASGSLLATSHKDGPVRLWSAQPRELLHSFAGPSGSWVSSLAFSPSEPLLAGGDWNGNITLYNTATKEAIPLPQKAHAQKVRWLAFSPDGRTLASAGGGGGLKLWRVAMRQVALTLKERTVGIAFSQDGNFMATCGAADIIRLWPAATPEEIAPRRPSQPHR